MDNGDGHTTTSCTACPTLTSGYAYVSGTGWDEYGDCQETKAYSSISSYCHSGALTKTATSATAWGTATSTLTAKQGSILTGTGDSKTCTQCSGATYMSDANGHQKTACYDCPAVGTHKQTTFSDSFYGGCSVNTTNAVSKTGATAITQCEAQNWVECTRGRLNEHATYNTSTEKYDVYVWHKWTGVNAGYYLTTKDTCGSYAYYQEAKPCEAGSYCPGKAESTCNSGNEATVHTTNYGLYTCVAGSYSTAGASVCTACGAGKTSTAGTTAAANCTDCSAITNRSTWATPSWNSNNTMTNLCTVDKCVAGAYKSGNTCPVCATDKWSSEGASSCTSCLSNYHTSGNAVSNHDNKNDCKIACSGGYYLKTANDTTCTAVGVGNYAASSSIAQGSVGSFSTCSTGLTTIGYGTGADESGDCGHKLHAGDGVLYLRSVKKGTPALNVKVGGTTFYGIMSTTQKNMSDGVTKKLKVKNSGTTYWVHDDSVN